MNRASSKQRRPLCTPCRSRGMSLIEALVTVTLLGISLLGMAMLHAQSFKFATGSYARTQANMLAYEIMDRMRVMAMDASVAMADYTASDPGGSCVYSGTVAANQRITNDLNCWYDKLDATLPNASGSITQAGDLFTVQVNWTELAIRAGGGADETGNQRQVQFTFQPSAVSSLL